MMPGDNHSKTVAIAADATVGNCQNCSVLHQSLNEYVSSFLALKQKITASDESIRLQQQLEELQIKLFSLEKKTADYESVQSELEEKKDALKAYGQMSEELQNLKQENSQIMAENKKLEDQLSDVKELTEKQSLENAQLKREKAVVENDLLEAQTSLMKSQAQADQIKHLMEEKAKATSINENLENKIRLFEDLMCKQNHQINQLTKEKILLEKNIDDLQARLINLERERNKDFRSSSTQASVPEEHKVDKEKVHSLLQNLWACIEPQQHTANLPLFGSCSKQLSPEELQSDFSNTSLSPQKTSKPQSYPDNTNSSYTQLGHSPQQPRTVRKETCQPSKPTRSKKKTATPKKSKQSPEEPKTEEADAVSERSELCVEQIMALFKPLLPCISPIPDVDSEINSLEAGDVKEMDITKNSDPHQQEPSSFITTSVSSHLLKASISLQEHNMVVPFVRAQEADHISTENNTMEQNKMDHITETKEEEEMQVDGDMQIEQELPAEAAEQLVSAPTSYAPVTSVCLDAVSPNTERQKPSCGANSESRGFNNTSGIETEKDYSSESIGKMDMDTNVSYETKTLNGGESPRTGDITVVLEQERGVDDALATSCTALDSARDAKVTNTENSLDKGQGHQDSCVLEESQKGAKPKENEECSAECIDKMRLSSSSDSNKYIVENLENDGHTQHLKEGQEAGDETHEKKEKDGNKMCEKKEEDEIRLLEKKEKGVDTTASPSVSNGDKLSSPAESPKIRTENVTCHQDQESSQANSETPLKQKANAEILNTKPADHGSSLSHPQETKNGNCESLQENTHSRCKTLSPSCLFPTVKLYTLETSPTKEQMDVAVDIKCILTSKKTLEPMFNTEEESTVKNTNAKDLPEDSTEASIHQVNEFDTDGHIISLNQNSSKKKRKNKCLESEKVPGPVVDSSTTKQPEFLGQLLTEMGPPLPPALTPVSTPPKACKSINPKQAIGKLFFPSPMDRVASPTTPAPPQARLTPNIQKQSTSSLSSPLRPNGVPSSPLQFGSATPKHAVPVPGRLPRTALVSSSPPSSSPSQENSMRILDTMYPDLSAHARTLSILRGNVNLSCSSDIGASPSMKGSQMSGFKTITSTPTAFTKAETRGEKRQADNLPQPNNRKCLRLENSPPSVNCKQVHSSSSNSGAEKIPSQNPEFKKPQNETTSSSMDAKPTKQQVIDGCLMRIKNSCFDLLPVIQSHLYVGNLPKKPVLTDEEKEVISEICQSSLLEADDVLLAILNKLKVEKKSLSSNYTQALCRIHTGICRQKRYWEKAQILAYSILKEDFPDAAKLILFMVTTWPTVLSHSSLLCKAIHTVTKLKAQENLLSCLSVFLSWEKSPPCDINELISKTLSDIRSGLGLSFTEHSQDGPDVGTEAWERICTLHLLCAHKKWMWTYENVLGKELWPLMNAWVMQPRDQQAPVSDVTVATVLRLIGRLSQLGINERNISSVGTAANVINTFGRHGHNEGVPWEVQLAAIYCIYDLSPVNPKQALDALAGWRGETSQSVPPSVMSCINQLASVCRQIKS